MRVSIIKLKIMLHGGCTNDNISPEFLVDGLREFLWTTFIGKCTFGGKIHAQRILEVVDLVEFACLVNCIPC